MIVIADTSPLQYAVEIGIESTFFQLYDRITIPKVVYSEAVHPRAPQKLREWVEANHRNILTVDVDIPNDPLLAHLDPGEKAAIALAQKTIDALLILDDRDGRLEARRRGIRITGLLGVIRDAALNGLIDYNDTIKKLQGTDFRLSSRVATIAREQYKKQAGSVN